LKLPVFVPNSGLSIQLTLRLCYLFAELSTISENSFVRQGFDILLHSLHITGCRGRENIVGSKEQQWLAWTLPRFAVPNGRLQGVSFIPSAKRMHVVCFSPYFYACDQLAACVLW